MNKDELNLRVCDIVCFIAVALVVLYSILYGMAQ